MKLVELLREAQFHGSNRLAEKYFRPLWVLALSSLLMSALGAINLTVSRYLTNPSYLTRVDSFQTTSIFPSVLLCPEIMFSEGKRQEFISKLNIPRDVNVTYLKGILSQLSAYYAPDITFKLDDLLLIDRVLKHNNMDEETAVWQLAHSCGEVLLRCRWRDRIMNCSELFFLELTEFGFCCVFNGRSLLRENRELNLHNRTLVRPDLWRTSKLGPQSGLMFVVNQSDIEPTDLDLQYKWLVLQAGQQYVESVLNGTAISPGMEVFAAYTTQSLRVSEDARRLTDHQRRCKLFREPLKYFPFYSRMYCLLECQMEQTWEKCKCVHITYPQQNHLPRCNASQILCARQTGVSLEMGYCNCPPACEFGTDLIEIQNQELREGAYPYDSIYDGLDLSKVTIVRTYILKHQAMISYRRSLFNSIDLFAQLGGVFNVFFGCSVLTLIEIAQLFWYGIREKFTK